jgi:hypothetical protein
MTQTNNPWRHLLSTVLTVVAVLGCYQTAPDASSQPVEATGPILKVAVFADGRLTVDEKPSTVDELRDSLARIREQGGAVWYYREAGQDEPPPIVLEVMGALLDAKLPIRLSGKPDYSDTIGPDGISRPQ